MKPTLQNVLRAKPFVALLAGVAFAVGGPPFPASILFIAYLGVIAFAVLLEGARPWRAAWLGGCFGLGMNLVVLSFVPGTVVRFTDIPLVGALAAYVLLAAGQAVAWSISGVVVALARKYGAPLVVAFPVGVWAATWSPTLFCWTLATPFARAPIFLQLAEVIGERGVAIVLAVACALVATAVRADRSRRAQILLRAVAIVAILPIFGLFRLAAIRARLSSAPRLSIALVQHAIPPKDRWDPKLAPFIAQQLQALTRAAQNEGAQLAVWPEAAYPYDLAPGERFDLGRIRGVGVHIDVLTGLLAAVPSTTTDGDAHVVDHFNAATIVTHDGAIAPIAAKLELLPFGEAVPFGEELPFLRRVFSRGGGLRPGKQVVLLQSDTTPVVRAGVLNCYEDTLPSLARRVAGAQPNLLVNVTNDAWFGETAEPELHLLAATARAIESRRDMVRAVNTGVTVHIDAFGSIVAQAKRETRTFLMVRPALLEDGPTIYVRFGDATWIVPLALALSICILLRRRTTQAQAASEGIVEP